MEKDSNAKRLSALDGIRGIAIILVFLNHAQLSYLGQIIPSPSIIQMITSSGVTGVSMLFVLSGFLMAYIYPNPASYTQFLQKRYTRIFPLFLTMCTVMLIHFIFPHIAWYTLLGVILGLALVVHGIWVYGIKKLASKTFNKTLFFLFLGTQILTALIYAFLIMRNPPIVFNQQLPEHIRNGMIWLTNVTLTLPFGNYIPQLDGVYWSLIAEILFYIFFPILVIPIIKIMTPRKRITKILFLLALVPFFAGIHIMSQRVWGFGIIQVQLFYYFASGIVLAYLLRNHPHFFTKLGDVFNKKFLWITALLFFAVVLSKTLIFDYEMKAYDVWIHLLWAFPMTLVFALALDSRTSLSKFLSSKVLVFIGTVSFSIYLSHVPIGIMLKQLYVPVDAFTNIVFILVQFGITVAISSLLYYLLERPYFMRTLSKSTEQKTQKMTTTFSPKKVNAILFGSCFVILVTLVNVYQSNFNFFSKEYVIAKANIISPKTTDDQTIISMKDTPKVLMEFTSTENDLEILTINIREKSTIAKTDIEQNLVFKIKERDAKDWYATNAYDFSDSDNHPFGFPTIHNAQGKRYLVELSMSNPQSPIYFEINVKDAAMKSVYKVDKKELITNPMEFFSFIANKINNVLANTEAQYVITLLAPYFLLCIYIGISSRKKLPE